MPTFYYRLDNITFNDKTAYAGPSKRNKRFWYLKVTEGQGHYDIRSTTHDFLLVVANSKNTCILHRIRVILSRLEIVLRVYWK